MNLPENSFFWPALIRALNATNQHVLREGAGHSPEPRLVQHGVLCWWRVHLHVRKRQTFTPNLNLCKRVFFCKSKNKFRVTYIHVYFSIISVSFYHSHLRADNAAELHCLQAVHADLLLQTV